jgi:hypothetical protein
LFALDGLPTNLSDNDIGRRNTIASLLEEWELCEIVNYDDKIENGPEVSINQIKIISHKEKDEWELCPKYHIGKKR